MAVTTLLPALASYQLAYSGDSIIIDLLKPKPGVEKKLKGMSRAVGFLLNPLYKKFNRFYDTSTAYYQKLLEKLLDNKRRAIYITFLMLVFLVSGFMLLKKEILPVPGSRKFEITANTIPAQGFEQTDMIGAGIEQQLLQIRGVDYVFAETGAVSTFRAAGEDISVNSIHFIVACRTPGDRQRVMRQAREILKKADLMEYANQLRDSGMGIREAVLTATRVRMRPILMTTITTVVGVVPMALMTSAGSDLERPLALVVLGGLTSLLFLTLFLIPVLYEAHENHREKKRQKRKPDAGEAGVV